MRIEIYVREVDPSTDPFTGRNGEGSTPSFFCHKRHLCSAVAGHILPKGVFLLTSVSIVVLHLLGCTCIVGENLYSLGWKDPVERSIDNHAAEETVQAINEV